MKIQLSKEKVIPDAITVWNQEEPGVEIIADLKRLPFAENFCDEIFSFHILDHYFPHEVSEALANWYKVLKPGGTLWLSVTDFEIICREFVGGGISVDMFNRRFTRPAYFTKENLVKALTAIGFKEDKLIIWFQSVPDKFIKEEYDLVLQCKK